MEIVEASQTALLRKCAPSMAYAVMKSNTRRQHRSGRHRAPSQSLGTIRRQDARGKHHLY